MDDLIHHCLRELAFEGDYGCDVERLREFISEYYNSDRQPVQQKVDAAFVEFVWSTLSSIPSVKIGLKPLGQHADVFVPTHSRKKAFAGEDGGYPGLEEIPSASSYGLAHLTEAHGYRLRIAVDTERCFFAITGSHSRSGKLTPIVYAALQLVAKAREAGISVLDLGRSLTTDQKTCYHIVKQLVELDLIVKLRRGGNTQNFCVHKFFYERSSMWREIRQAKPQLEEEGADLSAAGVTTLPSFSPMGSVHLSNLDLLRQRVIVLLKASMDETQPYVNFCLRVGYIPQQRTDRRFFLSRLLELAKEGTIEIIYQEGSAFNSQPQKFVRLARPSTQFNVDPALAADDEDLMVDTMINDGFGLMGSPGLASTKTLQRQVIELIGGSGTSGITISDLSDRLGSFDRRILSLLLSRLERMPPAHLVDLGIVQTTEFHFREKRFRYFTLDNATILASSLPDFELSHDLPPKEAIADAGGFRQRDRKAFYENSADLDKFFRKWDGKTQGRLRLVTTPKPPKQKREIEKKPPKEKKWINPILPDGTRKRGRPLKSQRGRKKSKTGEGDAASEDQPEIAEVSAGLQKRKRSDEDEDCSRSRPLDMGDVSLNTLPDQFQLQTSEETEKALTGHRNVNAVPQPELSTVELGVGRIGNGGSRRSSKRKKLENKTLDPRLLDPLIVEGSTNTARESMRIECRIGEGVEHVFSGDGNAGDSEANVDTFIPVADAGNTVGADQVETVSKPVVKSFLDELLPFEEVNVGRAQVRTKHSARNLTALRRENEILRVLEQCGGIVNTSGAEFLDMCRDVREAAIKAGKTASAPVTATMDRRTLNYSLDKLSSQGKIKIITTTLFSSSNAQRTAKIIHLPSSSDAAVEDFIASRAMGLLPTPEAQIPKNNINDVTLNTSTTLTEKFHDPGVIARRIMDVVDEGARLKQLFSSEDSVIREALLSERHTVSQLYGYLPGKTARARELHSFMLSVFDGECHPSTIVSSTRRIVDRTFFETDLPLYIYCMCFKAYRFDASLLAAIRSRGQRQQPLRTMPRAWHYALKTGQSKTREQVFELLHFLHGIKVVTPLVECRTADPNAISFVDDKGVHRALQPFLFSTPLRKSAIQPRFWMFDTATPLYSYGSKLRPIPYLKTLDLRTGIDLENFYGELRCASFSENEFADGEEARSIDREADESIANILRRPSSWSTEYRLSGLQKEFLTRFVDALADGESLDNGPTLRRLCEVSSAPLSVVQNFVDIRRHQRSRIFLGMRSRLRAEEVQATSTSSQLARQKKPSTSTRKDGKSTKQELDLAHSPSVSAIGTSSRQYGSTLTMLSERSSESGVHPYLSTQLLPYRFVSAPAPAQTHHQMAAGRSIKAIIDLQKNMVFEAGDEQQAGRKRNKNEFAEGDAKIQRRRQRFKWTDELDELARDAQAIIAVRCGNRRIEYGALDQVFPTIPHNSVRRRLGILHEQPGAEAYFKRLQNAWFLLWKQKRGSTELPDDDPNNLTKFDLPKHIEYLRRYVDKTAIRVGASIDSVAGPRVTLSADPDGFARDWNLGERGTVRAKPDFLLDAYMTEEAREKAFCEYAAVHADNDTRGACLAPDLDLFAEAVLKVVVGSPEHSFDSSAAAKALQKLGDDRVEKAMDKLLSENVLSRVLRDSSRLGPGRSVKIAEPNLSALGGPLSADIFEKASEVQDLFQGETEGVWQFVASEGETAAMLQAVSDHAVDFRFDCSIACNARKQVENSRKADDDDIELGIQVNLDIGKVTMLVEEEDKPPLSTRHTSELGHGFTCSNDEASCMFFGIGLVDCAKCIRDMTACLLAGLGEGIDTVRAVLETVDMAGRDGVTASDIRSSISLMDSMTLDTLIHNLHIGPLPLIHVVGNDSPSLISSNHIDSHTVMSMGDKGEIVKFFPRRWVDIRGKRVQEVWQSALRAITGEILLNPGVSQYQLRLRFRTIIDRAEILDVLDQLNGSDIIYYRTAGNARPCIECLTPDEEQDVFWFVNGGKRWYDV